MNEPALTVWFASYPKSGNTWLRALFAGATGDGTVRLNSLAASTDGTNQRAIFREFGISPSVLDDRLGESLMKELGASIALRSPETIFRKSHNSFSGDLPRGASHSLRTPCKGIYIVRDPRAVAVSVAYHMGCSQVQAVKLMASGPAESTREAVARESLESPPDDRFAGRGCQVPFGWGTWSYNVTSWIDQSDIPVSVIKYEDLLADTNTVMTELVEFLGLDVPPDLLIQAVQESSFVNLAVQEMFGGFVEVSSPDRQFFRRGMADSWKEELESGLEERIREDHSSVMTRLGYLP